MEVRALRIGGPLVVAAALLLWLAPQGAAQDKAGVLALRIVSMKASGKRAPEDEPRSDPTVRAYLPVLKPLGYDYYRGATSLVQRAPRGEELRFLEGLPSSYQARATWERTPKGELKLEIVLDHPDAEGERVQVLKAQVEARDGQHFVIRVAKAYPDGDLLLLMTAQYQAP